jgi:hypothetical protein
MIQTQKVIPDTIVDGFENTSVKEDGTTADHLFPFLLTEEVSSKLN